MSSMSYQSADASKDMKRPNIASFFSPAKPCTAATKHSPTEQPASVETQPQSSVPSAVKGEVTNELDSKQKPKRKVLNDSHAAGQHQQPGGLKEEEGYGSQQASAAKMQFPTADGKVEEVALPSSNVKQEPPDGNVLNADDAGGKGKPLLPVRSRCVLCSIWPTPCALAHVKTAADLELTAKQKPHAAFKPRLSVGGLLTENFVIPSCTYCVNHRVAALHFCFQFMLHIMQDGSVKSRTAYITCRSVDLVLVSCHGAAALSCCFCSMLMGSLMASMPYLASQCFLQPAVGGRIADEAEAAQQERLASPPQKKRSTPEQAFTSAASSHKRAKPAKGTIDSFFGRKN